jgi:hypothetical protein
MTLASLQTYWVHWHTCCLFRAGGSLCMPRRDLEEDDSSAAQRRIMGLLRAPNEEETIIETLDHLGTFCTGGIFVFHDASTDSTVRLCSEHRAVRREVGGDRWKTDREKAEYAHLAYQPPSAELRRH